MKNILKAISQAVNTGSMTTQEAERIRFQMLGINKSFFTKKKQKTKQERKAARKRQRTARRITLAKGYKGQKSPKGSRKVGV